MCLHTAAGSFTPRIFPAVTLHELWHHYVPETGQLVRRDFHPPDCKLVGCSALLITGLLSWEGPCPDAPGLLKTIPGSWTQALPLTQAIILIQSVENYQSIFYEIASGGSVWYYFGR